MAEYLMAVGAHADDIEANAGGTLLKYRELGYGIVYVMATNNMSGPGTRWRRTGRSRRDDRRGTRCCRRGSSRRRGAPHTSMRSCSTWTIPAHYRSDGETEVFLCYGAPRPGCVPEKTHSILTAHESPEARKALAAIIGEFRPEAILTHDPIQVDIEHIGTSLLVTKTVKNTRGPAWSCSGRVWTPRVRRDVPVPTNLRGHQRLQRREVPHVEDPREPAPRHVAYPVPPWEEGTGCSHVEAYAVVQDGPGGGEFSTEIFANRERIEAMPPVPRGRASRRPLNSTTAPRRSTLSLKDS